MKKLFLVFVMLFGFGVGNAEQCRVFTDEQQQVLDEAYAFGLPYDYGYTLAAIAMKESFVADRVLRYNPTDPSTGVTHIQFNTLKHLSGLGHWDSIELAKELIQNDHLSFYYSLKKLDSIKGTFWRKWVGYNGRGRAAEEYANDIQGIIKMFKRCGVLGGWS